MTLFIKIALFFLLIFINICHGAEAMDLIDASDTLPKDTIIQLKYNILNNLDSLNKLWFVKNQLPRKSDKSDKSDKSVKSDRSDKFYSRRISSLKSDIRLTYNDKVRKYIEMYLFEKKFQSEIMTGLFKNYVPIIDKAIAQSSHNSVPAEFKYMPLAESSLFNKAKSVSGATGIWQLSFSNAINYGLIVNSFIDERKDPLKSSLAATAYLKDLYKIYNDWLLAIAAYNSSPIIVNKAIRRAKGRMDFWSVYNYLPKDSREYVPAFIAAVYVMNYYKDYDFKPFTIKLPFEADTVVIMKQIHFKQISAVLKLPVEQISEMNPVYKRNIIPAKTDGNILVLPCGYGEKFYAFCDSISKYKDSSITAFMKLYPPFKDPSASYKTTASIEDIYYIVKSNDNLNKIAKYYGVTISDLKKWNHLKSKYVKKGQKLKIVYDVKAKEQQAIPDKIVKPVKQIKAIKTDTSLKIVKSAKSAKIVKPVKTDTNTKSVRYIKPIKVVKTDTNTKSAKSSKSQNVIQTKSDKSANNTKTAKSEVSDTYTVKPGDSLYKIAKSNGMTVKEILELNGFGENTIIKPGQIIKIQKCE